MSATRAYFSPSGFRGSGAAAMGMCGVSGGALQTPLLSLAPKRSSVAEQEDRTGSGFLSADPASSFVTVIGIVCDFDRNALMFYVDDQVVHTTRLEFVRLISTMGVKADDTARVDPFRWTLPRASADLRECRVYLATWQAYVTAEFVEWTPPPAAASTDNS